MLTVQAHTENNSPSYPDYNEFNSFKNDIYKKYYDLLKSINYNKNK